MKLVTKASSVYMLKRKNAELSHWVTWYNGNTKLST